MKKIIVLIEIETTARIKETKEDYIVILPKRLSALLKKGQVVEVSDG